MKIPFTFKTPDVVSTTLEYTEGLSEDQEDEIIEQMNNYVRNDEYLTVILDTETGNLEVVRRK